MNVWIRHSPEREGKRDRKREPERRQRKRETGKEEDRQREDQEIRESFILINSHGIVGLASLNSVRYVGRLTIQLGVDDSDLNLNSAGPQAGNSGYATAFS